MSTESLQILSLNCWGLKYISKHRNARLAEIGRQIAALDPPPNIVGLQECWTQEDFLSIRESTKHILPHGKFYYSGIFGGAVFEPMTALTALLSKLVTQDGQILIPGVYDGITAADEKEM